MVEKFNRTFENMIRNYVNESQTDWSDHLALIMFAYRTSVNDCIKVTPAEALQGRKFKLPIDVMRPPSLEFNANNDNQMFDDFLGKFQVIRSKARENATKSLEKRKKNYDKSKARIVKEEYKANDKVYWKKPIAKKGISPKLSQIWQGPFIIKEKLSDTNYVICDEKGTNVTIHVNNLKKCNDKDVKAKNIRNRGRPRKNEN